MGRRLTPVRKAKELNQGACRGYPHLRSIIIAVGWFEAQVERQGNRCLWCGADFTEEAPATLDHILPRSYGGTNDPANLRLLHPPCNVAAYQDYKDAL